MRVKDYVLIAAVIGCIFLFYQNENKSLIIEQKKSVIEEHENTIRNLNESITKYREQEKRSIEKLKEMERQMVTVHRQLNRYKERQDVVFAKPRLVERLEQKALDKFFDEVESYE